MRRGFSLPFAFMLGLVSIIGSGQSNPSINYLTKWYTEAEIAAANTAVNTTYLQAEERAVVLYSNLARLYPKKFAQHLKTYVAGLEPDSRAEYLNSDYYKSLLTDLATREPALPFYPDKVMYDYATCWAEESGLAGVTGHKRITCPDGPFAENCSYGPKTGFDIVVQLLVDDGVESLGHRLNILSTFYSSMGVAIRPHKDFDNVTVQDFGHRSDRERDEANQKQAAFKKQLSNYSADDIKKADVCRTLDYLNDYEKDFYFYINLIRINPKKFQSVFWGELPMFQVVIADDEAKLLKTERYSKIKTWLTETEAVNPIIPTRVAVEESRCMTKRKIEQRADAEDCLKEPKAWFISYDLPDNYYNDIMNLFVDMDEFFDFGMSDDLVLILEKGKDSFCKLVTY